MAVDYDDPLDGTDAAAPADVWDDSAVRRYLEQSQEADQDRIDAVLARIDDQLAARKTLHDEIVADLEWQVETYEQELDRLSKPGMAKTAAKEQLYDRLHELRLAMQDEHRAHWRDRQELERERRDLLWERAALTDDADLSELL